MKIDCFNESDFSAEEVEISDELYQLASDIHSQFGNYGQMVVKSDKQSLTFGVNKGQSREEREIGTRLYRVTITPVYTKEEIRDAKIKYIL